MLSAWLREVFAACSGLLSAAIAEGDRRDEPPPDSSMAGNSLAVLSVRARRMRVMSRRACCRRRKCA